MPTSPTSQSTHWPYPFWIAHRGAGGGPATNSIAPENTLAAFQAGFVAGYRAFECDVKLSADGVPFLLHDDTLDRTTDGFGVAGHFAWRDLTKLDAGSWHSTAFAGEKIPTLAEVADFCLSRHCMLNIEIKPTTGTDELTGAAVATAAANLWNSCSIKPLMSSFSVAALEAAMAATPELPRALLLDRSRDDWLEIAQRLDCVAVVSQHRLWTAENVPQAKSRGLRTLGFTVNEDAEVARLRVLGIDGLITDRVERFSPGT